MPSSSVKESDNPNFVITLICLLLNKSIINSLMISGILIRFIALSNMTSFLIHSTKIIGLICVSEKFQSIGLRIEYRFVTFHVVGTICDMKHIYANFLSIICIDSGAFLINLDSIPEFSEDNLFFADLRT